MIDLHCHTNVSDSNMCIIDVVKHAKERGVTHLAITDHDTTLGISIAKKIGEEIGVEIIQGIEISAYDYENNKRVHILGYFIEENNIHIKNLCNPLIKKRHEASINMIEILMNKNYNINCHDVIKYQGHTGIFKQHIMHCLKNKGYTNSIYSDLYKKLFNRENGEAYIPLEYVDYKEAIKFIKLAKGVPVLAHPGQFNNYSIIEKMVQLGLMGIEVRHPDHDEKEEEKCLHYINKYNLIKTGGTDFHGAYSNHQFDLGDKSISYEELKRLMHFNS